jgi:hypothetical protein
MKHALAILALAALVVGCGDDDTPMTGTDAGPTTDMDGGIDGGTMEEDGGPLPACDTGESYVYVLDVIDLGKADPADATVAPGFDLDGEDNTVERSDLSCGLRDFTSPAPDSMPGVDNTLGPALGELTDPDVSAEIRTAIASGQLVLLMRLNNVDDLANDDCVGLDILVGLLPDGVEAPDVTGERYTAGQTFDINMESLISADMPRVRVEGVTIEGGRIEAMVGDLPFELPTPGGDSVSLSLEESRVRFGVSASGITAGVLGGILDVADTVEKLSEIADPDVVELAVSSNADLRVDGVGDCQGVSIALVYEGVSAVAGEVRTP